MTKTCFPFFFFMSISTHPPLLQSPPFESLDRSAHLDLADCPSLAPECCMCWKVLPDQAIGAFFFLFSQVLYIRYRRIYTPYNKWSELLGQNLHNTPREPHRTSVPWARMNSWDKIFPLGKDQAMFMKSTPTYLTRVETVKLFCVPAADIKCILQLHCWGLEVPLEYLMSYKPSREATAAT